MAKRMSSPLTVLRFSCWHFSEASRVTSVAGGRRADWKRFTLARNEGDELADALLHAFLCFFGNLGVVGQCHLHDAGDWSKVTYVSI